jgi:hypothetical protein
MNQEKCKFWNWLSAKQYLALTEAVTVPLKYLDEFDLMFRIYLGVIMCEVNKDFKNIINCKCAFKNAKDTTLFVYNVVIIIISVSPTASLICRIRNS